MPFFHSADQIKSDADGAAKRICPECGAKIEAGSALGHVNGHWPRYADLKADTDAARRVRLILALDAPAKE
jgi:hypothetical protein